MESWIVAGQKGKENSMREVQNIIIGFGKAGKTLAGYLAKKGEKTVLIEENPLRYGGTCINVACIPSKSLENSARESAALGGEFSEKAERYQKAIEEKRRLTHFLRGKNLEKVQGAGVEVIDGRASFLDEHRILVESAKGDEEIRGERIFVNTGAKTIIPKIAGVESSKRVYTSESMMELDTLPKNLVIIGGGYIGLEFASYYQNFGSTVTILQDSNDFIPREDREMAKAIEDNMEKMGITLCKGVTVQEIKDQEKESLILFQQGGEGKTITADAILVATGRKPNVENLALEKAGLSLTERGAIPVDSSLRTKVPHIFAMGDVTGGMQFTYISLDDFRIVKAALEQEAKGEGTALRSTENRGAIPYSVFLTPAFSRVGITEEEAKAQGKQYRVAKLPVAAIPKAQVLRQTAGLLKVIIEEGSNLILGAHLYCPESYEMINLIKLAMDQKIPANVLASQIYTHPTMTEAFNDLLG